ncbi:hypothetical protein OG992_16115 [Micromonospora sp. NBC_00362]|uniref:hypothetical protein n=1 Tax=unclassified Micromonospora TaxID=2617518 RepID=UPI00225938B7|nr:hypothetical protein [Micromonospora sp. NBC_00362]MCX5118708.1 hypothetical protein [Micromonospora sp. NBC_00362]WTI09144.1 hypothetical protein OHB44_05560 [Micromonospora sp. NBC_00821]
MLTAAQVLAENNFGDTRTGGLAGPMGLFLILLLATATILLIRNMNARLRRLPDRFPQQSGATDPTRADAAVVDPTDGTGGRDSSAPAPNGHQQHLNG